MSSNNVFLQLLLLCVLHSQFISAQHHRMRRIVGGVPAEAPEEDEPVVFVRFAGYTAKVIGARDFPHYVFKGLRFAEPPKGKDRFQVMSM